MPDLPDGEVVIKSITGDDGRLPLVASNNCVGIAAIETIKLLGDINCGVALTLLKVCGAPNMLLLFRGEQACREHPSCTDSQSHNCAALICMPCVSCLQ